jgi:hypothetical protein
MLERWRQKLILLKNSLEYGERTVDHDRAFGKSLVCILRALGPDREELMHD